MNDKNNNNSPDNDETGEIMSWVITFILLVAFWPIGLILLLKKLNVFGKSQKNDYRQRYDQTVKNARNAARQYKEAARAGKAVHRDAASEIAQTARETASEIAQSAREAGQTTRQIISEIYADLAREFAPFQTQNPRTEQNRGARQAQAQAQAQAQQAAQAEQAEWKTYRQTQTTEQPQTEQAAQPRQNQVLQEAQWFDASSYAKPKMKAKKDRSTLEKKSGRAVSVILLIISVILLVLGVNTTVNAARDIWINGLNRWPDLFLGSFYLFGGFITFIARKVSVRRLARYKRYYAFFSGRSAVSLEEIARTTGESSRVVRRDIQAMVLNGYLGRDAYIDRELKSLILSEEGAADIRRTPGKVDEKPAQATAAQPQNQYMAILLELREINDSIIDSAISYKVERIEETTAKIFRAVEEDPAKLPQIRRFMSYYLPTTQKLLRSYATLEKQGIKGENITSTKESIERILDTLEAGFEQQLDQLFSSDAIDIASDINVLESLMQQDGLTGDKPEMKTLESV